MSQHPLELISAYADGELTAHESKDVEAHLAVCTECARELALIRALGGVMKAGLAEGGELSLWPHVLRSISTPVGWLLLVAGMSVWAVLGVIQWFQAGELTLGWLATTAAGVGLSLIAVGVGYEQYQAWKSEPYRHIER